MSAIVCDDDIMGDDPGIAALCGNNNIIVKKTQRSSSMDKLDQGSEAKKTNQGHISDRGFALRNEKPTQDVRKTKEQQDKKCLGANAKPGILRMEMDEYGALIPEEKDETTNSYKYRDFSGIPLVDIEHQARENKFYLSDHPERRHTVRLQKFPVKLYAILAQNEFHNIISWLPHGRSWAVHKPNLFEKLVMPIFFEYSNYHSFNRLVNAWSFRRVSHGPDKGSYFHELFLRGKPYLQNYMRRLPKTHKKLFMRKADQPDFHALDRISQLPASDFVPFPFGSNDPNAGHRRQFTDSIGNLMVARTEGIRAFDRPQFFDLVAKSSVAEGRSMDVMHGLGEIDLAIARPTGIEHIEHFQNIPVGHTYASMESARASVREGLRRRSQATNDKQSEGGMTEGTAIVARSGPEAFVRDRRRIEEQFYADQNIPKGSLHRSPKRLLNR